MKVPDFFLAVMIIFCLVCAAGCSQTAPVEKTPPVGTPVTASADAAGNLTPQDVVSFLDKAVAYAQANGKEKAIAAFNDPYGEFSKDGLFVFAIAYDGTALAEPFQPELTGTSLNYLTDPYGVPIVRNLAETARFGRGYVSYDYPNPVKNKTVEPKLTVVSDVDGSYYVGAGMYESMGMIYPSAVLRPATKNFSEADMVAFVKRAVAYAKENGREKAIAAFNDRNGSFFDGPLTIIALDYNGTALASSLSPDIVAGHINLINYHDPDGVATIREMRDLSKTGGGYSYTVAKGTKDGREILIPKIDYAEPVDNNWWLFSGIIVPGYEQLNTGNLTGIEIRDKTRAEAFDLLDRAAAFEKENGKEKTLAEINNPNGLFSNGNLFVWAETHDGTLLADPYWKAGIGKNFMNFTDSYGAMPTLTGINALKAGTGVSHAMFADTSKNSTVLVPKLVCMKAIDNDWWIGSGVYGVQVA